MADEDFNPLRDGEVNAGPAVGFEKKLEKVIGALAGLVGLGPKAQEIIDHNLTMLSDTGPRRPPEAPNKNYKKRERRKRWREQKGQ